MVEKQSLKTRIFRGIAVNAAGQVLMTVGRILIIPIFLSAWTVDYYGEWLLIYTIPGYLSISDLGLGTVASTKMTMNVAQEKNELVNSVFNSAWALIFAVGVLVCSLFVLGIQLGGVFEFLGLASFSETEFKTAIFLLTGYIFFTIQGSLIYGLYRVNSEYSRGQSVLYVSRTLELAAMMSALLLGGNAVEVAAMMLLVKGLTFLFIVVDTYRRSEWLSYSYSLVKYEAIKDIIKPSLSMTAVYSSQSFVNQGIVTIIGVKLGPVDTVVFSTTRTLINVIRQGVNVVNLTVFSEFASSMGKGDLKTVRSLFKKSVFANAGLTIIAVAGLFVLGPYILDVWTNGKVNPSRAFFSCYLLYMIVFSFYNGAWNMIIGLNEHHELSIRFLVVSLAGVAAMYALLPIMGLVAVPVALLFFEAIFGIGVYLKASNLLGYKKWALAKELLSIK